jgi:acyl carrier protein
MTASQEIRQFIETALRRQGIEIVLSQDYPLIDNDLLDSLMLMELISFLEESFSIVVDSADIVPENFATVGAIAVLVARQQQAGQSSP